MKLLSYLILAGFIFIHPAVGATYYVSSTGNDSNNGLSPGAPWQTIAKVNGNTYGPGDSVFFEGGETFSGTLSFRVRETSTSPFTIGSYGTGRAVIGPGVGPGLYAYNCSGIVIQNIDFTGSGAGTNTNHGIEFYADLAGNMKLNYIRIDSVNVSGFGRAGIIIGAWNNLTGYNDVRVTNAIVHDNHEDGLQVYAQNKGANTNIYLGHSQFYNNTGRSGPGSPSGSGAIFGEVNGGTIEFCAAHNNGALNTSTSGPVGLWCYDSNSVLIQYNESYSNTTSEDDGDGFDLDGGTTNSYLQYNYSHDNKGGGLCLFQYAGASAHKGNIVRYNISQNDGSGVAVWGANSSSLVTGDSIYGNIIFTGRGDGVDFYNANCSGIAVIKNIIVTAKGYALVRFPGSSGVSFNYDDYWASAYAFVISWNGQTYSSLSAWQTATGQEKNGQNVDPAPFSGAAPAYWYF